jgi:hypothetical protein
VSQLRSQIRPLRAITAAALTAAFLLSSSLASAQVIFNSIANPLPANMPSQPFQAQQVSEFGSGIVFSPGTPRSAASVTIIMSSFGCVNGRWNIDSSSPAQLALTTCVTTPGSTFTHPVTLNVYSVGPLNAVGTLLYTKTQNFAMPYRPSADLTNCTGADTTAGNKGKWFDPITNTCNNGIAFPITFDTLGSPFLPNSVIVTVAYNTSNYGAAPIGAAACGATVAGCFYDSLNVGAQSTIFTVGSYLDPSSVYLSSITPGVYCLAGPDSVLRRDSVCWTGFQPQIRVTATPPGAFHVRYFSNLTLGDSFINITNSGGSILPGNADINNGNICANVYTYSPDEQLVSCCTCQVTPNGLAALSVRNDLVSNTLTPVVPSSVVVKMVATSSNSGACNAATVGTLGSAGLALGMEAWGSTLHVVPGPSGVGVTETPFSLATLTEPELTRMSQLCAFIRANGSGYGVCKSCAIGGLGAKKK